MEWTSVTAEQRAYVPASARSIVCHFLHEVHCEYCLKQLGSRDPYRPAHNSVYMRWRKRGHGAQFGECVCFLGHRHVCVMSSQCVYTRDMTKFTL